MLIIRLLVPRILLKKCKTESGNLEYFVEFLVTIFIMRNKRKQAQT